MKQDCSKATKINQKLEGVWTLEKGTPHRLINISLWISLFWILKILAVSVSKLSPQFPILKSIGLFGGLPSLCQNLARTSRQTAKVMIGLISFIFLFFRVTVQGYLLPTIWKYLFSIIFPFSSWQQEVILDRLIPSWL